VTGGTPKNLANAEPDSVDDYLRVWFRRRKGAESERGRAYISLVGPGRFLHSVSASPDDDLPPGKHIVWGDEAKPPVFGHWPTALLYGPRPTYIWPEISNCYVGCAQNQHIVRAARFHCSSYWFSDRVAARRACAADGHPRDRLFEPRVGGIR
jgi:hypothetical protein